MAVTVVSFRWLEILEKEFDKNFVDLDLLIGDLDAEEPDLVYTARQKLAGLSSCFAQLTHKAQTVFQNSAKIEAELVDLRAEVVNSKTRQEVLEDESRSLVLQLHSLQLDRLPSNQNPEQYKEKIDNALKLSPTKASYSDEVNFKNSSEIKKLKNEVAQYRNENLILRNSILALHSEVYGARLAAKYLDKELAGRIQQLQLLGKEMKTEVRDKLWRQLESEILLHRHKTVIRACRNKTTQDFIQSNCRVMNFNQPDNRSMNKNIKLADSQAVDVSNVQLSDVWNDTNNNDKKDDKTKASDKCEVEKVDKVREKLEAVEKQPEPEEDSSCMIFENRTVVVKRQHGQGLGISITGGREHGVPILISELEIGGPAYECKNLFVGDAILKVNNISLENVSHFEAVKVLTNLEWSDVELVVQYIATESDEENSLSEDLYGYRYRFFDTEVMDSSDALGLHPLHSDSAHTPTAPRTPEYVREVNCEWNFSRSVNLLNRRCKDVKSHVVNNNNNSTADNRYVTELENLEKKKIQPQVEECCLIDIESDLVEFNQPEKPVKIEEVTQIEETTSEINKCNETLKIDLFGYDFKTDLNLNDYMKKDDNSQNQSLEDICKSSPSEAYMDEFLSDGNSLSNDNVDRKNSSDDSIRSNDIVESVSPDDQVDIDLTSIVSEFNNKQPSEEFKYIDHVLKIDSKPLCLEYVDETIFSGLEDHSIIDNIVKSFSDDNASIGYLDDVKEKQTTSDSGLEIYYPSSSDIENNCFDKISNSQRMSEKVKRNVLSSNEGSPGNFNIELKTLQQIFDRSFSSNLSSPHGSTSFDEDILSTEQSDEKNGNFNDVLLRNKSFNDLCKTTSGQKSIKNMKKPLIETNFNNEALSLDVNVKNKVDQLSVMMKNDLGYSVQGKRCKRNSIDNSMQKRNKINRKIKSNESTRNKEIKKNKEELLRKNNDVRNNNKRDLYKISDRFDENLIEYSPCSKPNYEINVDTLMKHPVMLDLQTDETNEVKTSKKSDLNMKVDVKTSELDELEETRMLSKKYGLKLPGKCVKQDINKLIHCHLLSDTLIDLTKSPVKIIESHFKHFKPAEQTTSPVEKEKIRFVKNNRYDSFGDPDFGTPV